MLALELDCNLLLFVNQLKVQNKQDVDAKAFFFACSDGGFVRAVIVVQILCAILCAYLPERLLHF